jgi:hypothetical protein
MQRGGIDCTVDGAANVVGDDKAKDRAMEKVRLAMMRGQSRAEAEQGRSNSYFAWDTGN